MVATRIAVDALAVFVTLGIFFGTLLAWKKSAITGLALSALFWVAIAQPIMFGNVQHWGPFRPVSWWVGLTVGILAVIAIVIVNLADTTTLRKGWAYVPAFGALVLAVCIGFVGITTETAGAKTPATAPTFQYTQKTPSQCSQGFNVQLNSNLGNRVLSNGLNGKTAAQNVMIVMNVAQHDPRVLELYYNATPQGRQHPITDFHTLLDPATGNGCYSTYGAGIYNQTLGAFEAAIKSGNVHNTTAPSSGVNTGVTGGGGAPFQEALGKLTGNLAATSVTFADGSTVYMLHRCGNLVTAAPIPGVTVINVTQQQQQQQSVVVNLPPPTTVVHHQPPPGTTTTTTPTTVPVVVCSNPAEPYVNPAYPGGCGKCPVGVGAVNGGTIEQGGTPCGGGVNNPTTIQVPASPGPTPDYTSGTAESTTQSEQPASAGTGGQGDTSGNTATPNGTDTGSYQGGSEPVQSGGDNGDTSGGSSTITATTPPPPDTGSASGNPDPNAGGPS